MIAPVKGFSPVAPASEEDLGGRVSRKPVGRFSSQVITEDNADQLKAEALERSKADLRRRQSALKAAQGKLARLKQMVKSSDHHDKAGLLKQIAEVQNDLRTAAADRTSNDHEHDDSDHAVESYSHDADTGHSHTELLKERDEGLGHGPAPRY